MIKSNLGGKGLFQSLAVVHQEGKSGQELMAGTKGEAMEGH